MNAPDTTLITPLPRGESVVSMPLSLFGLLGGPLAWFAETCAGYAFASWACFPKDQRRFLPLEGYDWTWSAIVAVCIAAFLTALAACLVSWRIRQRVDSLLRTRTEAVLPLAMGRTRFLATWGMAAGGGFAIAVAFTAVALFILPQCAG